MNQPNYNFAAIVEESPVLIWQSDEDGKIIYYNQSWLSFTGRTLLEDSGDGWQEVVHSDDVARTVLDYATHLKEKTPFELEYRLKRHDGVYKWILDKGIPQHDTSGKFTGYIGYCFDITRLKKSEELHRKDKERLSGIVRGTNSGTWEWNVQTNEVVLNERYANIIGYSLAELSPTSLDTFEKYCHPEDLKKSYDLINKHFRGELPYYECELRMKHRNGDWVWILDLGKVIEWTQDGKPLHMMGTHTDITESKHLYFELIEEKEKAQQIAKELEEAQKIANIASWHLELKSGKVTWSEELYKMYGFDSTLPPPDYEEQEKIFTPESWETLTTHLSKTSTEGIPYELELNFIKKDGSLGWMWVKGEAIFDDSEQIVGLRGVAQDITKRKNMALELENSRKIAKQNEERLLVASQSAELGIWDWDLTTNQLIWNKRMFEMYDHDECDSPTFDYWYERIHPDDRDTAMNDLNKANSSNEAFKSVFRIIHRNGRVYYIVAYGIYLRDKNGKPYRMIGVNRDITESKNKEKTLETKNKQLTDFSNIVAHNLRAPLVNLGLLLDHIEESEEKQERDILIEQQRTVLNHLNEVFDELIESIQIRQDADIPSETLNLTTSLNKICAGLQSIIESNSAQINIDFNEVSTIKYPKKYLDSILSNLVSNALKYRSPDRNPIINIKTEVQQTDVILAVQDNGLGIDMNLAKDNLFKIRKVFHNHPDAKGFGLFLTKTQLEAMGDTIWVESEPGVGSTFYVKFKNQLHGYD